MHVVLADPVERAAERDATSFTDFLITEVEADDPERATITVGDAIGGGIGGWTTSLPWPDNVRKPVVGDRIRCYGGAYLGGRVSGVDLWVDGDWVHVFFHTKRELDVEAAVSIADSQARQRTEFEAGRAKLDALYDALPDPLKVRIDRFRAEDPDFRWREEAYEMAACAEAGRLYRAALDPATGELLKANGIKLPKDPSLSSWDQPVGEGVTDWEDTPENRIRAIDSINGAPNSYDYPLLERLFPWIDRGHSGNTWGAAVHFALRLVRGEKL